MELAGGIDHYRPAEAARLATMALEVLAARLAHELDGDGWVAPEGQRRVLLVQIQGFIQRHLGDAGQSPGTVAAANHTSVSYLHKLVHAEGITVAGWIRQRRLEGSHRDLADPALAARPVAAIGARWGSGVPRFSQVFKEAQGMAPGQYRLGAGGRRRGRRHDCGLIRKRCALSGNDDRPGPAYACRVRTTRDTELEPPCT